MHSGNFRPLITPESVQSALSSLRNDSDDEPQSLHTLAVVDDFLEDIHLPQASIARQFALKSFLTTLITSELNQLREAFHLKAISEKITLHQFHSSLQEQSSSELIAWSHLYADFVRPEFNILQKDFAQMVGFETKTLNRYRKKSLDRLTGKIIEAERQTRIQHHQRRLRALIPLTDKIPLTGRENEIQQIESALAASGSCIYLSGLPGTGKTRLICDVLRRLIGQGRVDILIWVDSPRSIKSIYQKIEQQLIPTGSAITARETTLSNRVVIVLDSLEILKSPDMGLWRDFLEYYNHATIFIGSQIYYPSESDITHIRVKNLDFPASCNLVSALMHYHRAERTAEKDIQQIIWQSTQGNPASVKLAFAQIEYGNADFSEHLTAVRVYDGIYRYLPQTCQNLWCLMAIVSTGMTFEQIETVIEMHQAAIDELIRRSLLEYEPEQRQYRLLQAAEHYIQQFYIQNPDFRVFLHETIQNWLETAIDDLSWLAESVFKNHWLALSDDEIRHILRKWWRYGLQKGQLDLWSDVFQRVTTDSDPELQLAYAVCLRRTGQPESAQHILRQVLSVTGRKGQFEIQIEALVEQAVLLRTTGKYQQSIEMLNRAEDLSRHYQKNDTRRRIAQEFAQIAIDTGDMNQAIACQKKFPGESIAELMLMEVYYLAQQHVKCRETGLKLIEQPAIALLDRAAVHTIMGRSYLAEKQFTVAISQFESAVNLYERSSDYFASARAMTNLAALYIETGDFDHAETLLYSAQDTQSQLKDVVGLDVTQLNLQRLRRRRISS